MAAPPVLDALASGPAPVAEPKIGTPPEFLIAKQWALVIDTRQFHSEADVEPLVQRLPLGAQRPAHDRTALGDQVDLGDRVRARLHAARPTTGLSRVGRATPLPGAVQPLREPALRAGLPDQGHLQAAPGRHRDDGLPPLHRLPVLHGRLPLRRAQLQLHGAPAVTSRRAQSSSSRRARRAWSRSATSAPSGWPWAKCPACVEACEGRALAFGDLDDPDSEVRKLLEPSTTPSGARPNLGTEPAVYYIV